MSDTFKRVDLAQFVHGNIIVGTETERTLVTALRAAYAENDRLQSQLIALQEDAMTIYGDNDRLTAEIDRLRANALEWVTVTDDLATLPEHDLLMILVCPRRYGLSKLETSSNEARDWLEPGDRWAYIPEVQP